MSWWTAPSGAAVVAAYDPIQGSSLADSYINRANPGTNNAAPGTAPTWAYGTGWTFAQASSQYLTTGIVPASGYSMIMRFSDYSVGALAGQSGVFQATGQLLFAPTHPTIANRMYFGWGSSAYSHNPNLAGGVVAIAGNGSCYVNGALAGSTGGSWTTSTVAIQIAANGLTARFCNIKIQAVAIYSATLTLADVVAITAAMNALPVAAAKGLPIIAHHYRQIFGG